RAGLSGARSLGSSCALKESSSPRGRSAPRRPSTAPRPPATVRRLAARDAPRGSLPSSSPPPNELTDEAVVPQRRDAELVVHFKSELQGQRRIEPVIGAEGVPVTVEGLAGVEQPVAAEVDPRLPEVHPGEPDVVEAENALQLLQIRVGVVILPV